MIMDVNPQYCITVGSIIFFGAVLDKFGENILFYFVSRSNKTLDDHIYSG